MIGIYLTIGETGADIWLPQTGERKGRVGRERGREGGRVGTDKGREGRDGQKEGG